MFPENVYADRQVSAKAREHEATLSACALLCLSEKDGCY